jgi:DNA modification methylase
LVWAIALEGKNDKDRFDALGWNIRTWDYWYWGKCDQRFGDDWPGRIPAQMIAHILYYFSDQNDLVWDPMAGGGVVADTSLALNRKCRSFDLDDRADTRPEIEPFFWDPNDLKWPITDTTKPDLILFDPPYFQKKAADYDPKSISALSRAEYLKFLKSFFALAHQNAKETTQMAFINADWRDFQGTPARNETATNAIMIDDYLDIIKKSGWQRTHILQAPLTSERFNAAAVSAMQKKRIIGVISRYVIMARRAG